jgi:hypothetical protein
VSKFAVSQALSGKPGVAEETRMRIIQTANEMRYSWKTKFVKKEKTSGAGPNGKASAAKSTVMAALAEREVGIMIVRDFGMACSLATTLLMCLERKMTTNAFSVRQKRNTVG